MKKPFLNECFAFYRKRKITYDSYMGYEDFKIMSKTQKDNALLKACVIDNDANWARNITKLSNTDISHTDEFKQETYAADIEKLKMNSLIISKFSQNYIEAKVKVDGSKILFLSIPYDKGWSALVDGKKEDIRKVNIGFSGIYLNEGEHQIKLRYFTPFLKFGLILSTISLFIYCILAFVFTRRAKSLFCIK